MAAETSTFASCLKEFVRALQKPEPDRVERSPTVAKHALSDLRKSRDDYQSALARLSARALREQPAVRQSLWRFPLPPRRLGDRSLDARADIYALGATMYHAVTGLPPFRGDNPFAVMMTHARDAVVPPSEMRPDLPHDLGEVILRCLAKKASDRYLTVKALGEALAGSASASDLGVEAGGCLVDVTRRETARH